MSDYPDFSVVSLLKGFYAGAPKPLALDANGYMIALLNGLYGGNPTGLQCDASGNIQINLKAQDLDELTNRSKYGAPDHDTSITSVAGGATETLFTLSGKGQIYNNLVYVYTGSWFATDMVTIEMDGETIVSTTYTGLINQYPMGKTTLPINILTYDPNTPNILLGLTPGWTFESNYTVKYYHAGAPNLTVYNDSFYSLI